MLSLLVKIAALRTAIKPLSCEVAASELKSQLLLPNIRVSISIGEFLNLSWPWAHIPQDLALFLVVKRIRGKICESVEWRDTVVGLKMHGL